MDEMVEHYAPAEFGFVTERSRPSAFAISCVRALPVVAFVGASVFGIALAASETTSTVSSSTARLALTDEVRWPFFDAATSKTSDLANADELVDHLNSEFEGLTYVITVESPDQLVAIVDITIEADNEEVAEEVAQAAGTWVVAQGEVDRVQSLEQVRDQKQTAIDDLDAFLLDAGQTADDLAAQITTTTAAAELERLQRVLRLTNEEIDVAQQTRLALQVEVDELNRQMASLSPQTEIVSITTASSADASSSTLAAAAAIGSAILAGIGSLIYQREYGLIESVEQVEQVTGLTAATYPISLEHSHLPGLFRPFSNNARVVVGIEKSTAPAFELEALSQELSRIGLKADVTTLDGLHRLDGLQKSHDGDNGILLVEMGSGPDRLSASLHCDAAILLIDRRTDRMRDVRLRLESTRALGLPVIGIVVVQSLSTPTQPSEAGSADDEDGHGNPPAEEAEGGGSDPGRDLPAAAGKSHKRAPATVKAVTPPNDDRAPKIVGRSVVSSSIQGKLATGDKAVARHQPSSNRPAKQTPKSTAKRSTDRLPQPADASDRPESSGRKRKSKKQNSTSSSKGSEDLKRGDSGTNGFGTSRSGEKKPVVDKSPSDRVSPTRKATPDESETTS